MHTSAHASSRAEERLTCDLLVIGSGAGGLSAAVTAAHLGLKVLVIEKESVVGGTTAWSGGWMWVPRNPLAVEGGIVETVDQPRLYLRHELGDRYDERRVEAFLQHGPGMVSFFRSSTQVQFIAGNTIPDFHGKSPGAREGGRSVCAAPYDLRELGEWVRRFRAPLDVTTLAGMSIGSDVRRFLGARESLADFTYVGQRLLRHAKDLALHRRGMHVFGGNALAARLLRSALDAGVEFRLGCRADSLLTAGGRVSGARVRDGQADLEITAARGVVLACGGFPHDVERRKALFSHAPTGREHWSAAPPTNIGLGIRLGEAIGAAFRTSVASAAAWVPVSLVSRARGDEAVFPHFLERGKPGCIAVSTAGKRFVNEADSYHDVGSALAQLKPATAWLICDHTFIRRYGLGFAKPAPLSNRASLRSGYLKIAPDLPGLAAACGIDGAQLQRTVARYNEGALRGQDADFGRGDTAFNRAQGDPSVRPNPCMAPLSTAPYYAVRLLPGSLGTFAGLQTNEHGQVLSTDGGVIDGLYANGNDAVSVMGGTYPAGGITLGPAMTFGYLLAHHAAGTLPAPTTRTKEDTHGTASR